MHTEEGMEQSVDTPVGENGARCRSTPFVCPEILT